MKKIYSFFAIVGVLVFSFACSTIQNKKNEDSGENFRLRPFSETTLKNGLKIIFVKDLSLPKISLGLIMKAGSFDDPYQKEGLNYFTAMMLSQGTNHMSAETQANEFGQIASELHVAPGADYTMISASTISSESAKLLEIFSDSIMNPKFDSNEIERIRSRILTAIGKQSDNPSSYADMLIDQRNFQNSPYAHSTIGEAVAVQNFSRSDLLQQYLKYYRPDRSFMYVAGAFDDQLVNRINTVFSSWSQQDSTSLTQNVRPILGKNVENEEKFYLYSKPELQQAQIRFAQRSIKRNDPDFLTLRLANLALGGDFVSRLNFRVRGELGLTYSIQSSFQPLLEDGSFEISTFSRNDKVKETIVETMSVLDKFVEEGMTQKELDSAKALMLGQFPTAIETTEKLAVNLLILKIYGIDEGYLRDFIKNVKKVSLSEVNAAIRKHLSPSKIKILIYADKKNVEDQLGALSSKYGKLFVEDVKSQKPL